MVELPQDFIGIGVEPNLAEMLTYLFSLVGVGGVEEVVTSGSLVNISADVRLVFLNKIITGDTTIQLGPVAQRTVASLQVVDLAGTAGTITILPFGAEKIMGLSSASLLSYAQGAGSAASQTFWSNISINGWYIA